jgi:hypothetical protein
VLLQRRRALTVGLAAAIVAYLAVGLADVNPLVAWHTRSPFLGIMSFPVQLQALALAAVLFFGPALAGIPFARARPGAGLLVFFGLAYVLVVMVWLTPDTSASAYLPLAVVAAPLLLAVLTDLKAPAPSALLAAFAAWAILGALAVATPLVDRVAPHVSAEYDLGVFDHAAERRLAQKVSAVNHRAAPGSAIVVIDAPRRATAYRYLLGDGRLLRRDLDVVPDRATRSADADGRRAVLLYPGDSTPIAPAGLAGATRLASGVYEVDGAAAEAFLAIRRSVTRP